MCLRSAWEEMVGERAEAERVAVVMVEEMEAAVMVVVVMVEDSVVAMGAAVRELRISSPPEMGLPCLCS